MLFVDVYLNELTEVVLAMVVVFLIETKQYARIGKNVSRNHQEMAENCMSLMWAHRFSQCSLMDYHK